MRSLKLCAATVAGYLLVWLFIFTVAYGDEPKPNHEPALISWWCHDQDDAIVVIKSPLRAFVPLMMMNMALKKCGISMTLGQDDGSYTEYNYMFIPSDDLGEYQSADGDKYLLLRGVILPGREGGVEVYTGKPLNPEQKPKIKAPPHQEIPGQDA